MGHISHTLVTLSNTIFFFLTKLNNLWPWHNLANLHTKMNVIYDESEESNPIMSLKQCPHLYANAEWGMQKWEKCWCGRVAKAQRTAFVCVANIWWTAKCLFEIGTSKKNTFAMLGVRSTRWTPNNPLFWHSFGVASVPHASFSFAYRYGHTFTILLRYITSWCFAYWASEIIHFA